VSEGSWALGRGERGGGAASTLLHTQLISPCVCAVPLLHSRTSSVCTHEQLWHIRSWPICHGWTRRHARPHRLARDASRRMLLPACMHTSGRKEMPSMLRPVAACALRTATPALLAQLPGVVQFKASRHLQEQRSQRFRPRNARQCLPSRCGCVFNALGHTRTTVRTR